MTKKAELARNTFIIFLGKVSSHFISFLLLPLYTSFLNKSEYGTIDLIITYISLLIPIITLQQEMATFRFLIDYRNDKKKTEKVIYNSIRNISINVFIFVLIYGFLSLFISIPYKLLIVINVVITIYCSMFLQISRGIGNNKIYSIVSIIVGITNLLINIISIILLDIGAKGILVASVLANLVGATILFIYLRIGNSTKKENKDKQLTKQMFKYSIPLVPNGVSWWIINVSDRTIISAIIGVAANGIYAVSTKFSSIISAVFSILNMSLTESVSVHINDADRDSFFSDIADTIIRIFSCLCILIIAGMPFMFGIFVKDTFKESYNYIPINLLASFFNCIVGIYSSIYIAKKLTKKVASTSIISAVINVSFNLIFIKIIGVYAACISTVIAYLIMAIYRHIDLKKYVVLKYKPLTMMLTTIAFSIVMISYYFNNRFINILTLLLTVIYSVILNRNSIKFLIARIDSIIHKQ